jgi:hypothetical protein
MISLQSELNNIQLQTEVRAISRSTPLPLQAPLSLTVGINYNNIGLVRTIKTSASHDGLTELGE